MGAPWKCKTCGCRWYSMGPPTGYCMDCGSDDIDIDLKTARSKPKAKKPR
jgi:hypothetical protein